MVRAHVLNDGFAGGQFVVGCSPVPFAPRNHQLMAGQVRSEAAVRSGSEAKVRVGIAP
jgi:hypothetical protein